MQILLISGSLRSGSTNTAALETARLVAPPGLSMTFYEGMATLPHFNPDDDLDTPPAAVLDYRARLQAADAVLLSTPEYAGALPGSFKNALEWTVGSGDLMNKPVGWINASGSPTKAADAYDSLRKVLGYVGAVIVEDACADVPVPRSAVGPDGAVTDPAIRDRIAAVVAALAHHVSAAAVEEDA
jgi:chromate reductase, NAD(P)H dehydrogenase (quinone)